MFQRLKKQWRDLKKGRPGTRFEQRYRSKQQTDRSVLAKPLYMAAGILMFLAGIVLLPAPGPGVIVVAFGAALIAGESYFAARALDWLEVKVRRLLGAALRAWRQSSLALKILILVAVTAVTSVLGWGAYKVIF